MEALYCNPDLYLSIARLDSNIICFKVLLTVQVWGKKNRNKLLRRRVHTCTTQQKESPLPKKNPEIYYSATQTYRHLRHNKVRTIIIWVIIS